MKKAVGLSVKIAMSISFLIWLTLTVLLNHTEQLGFLKRPVEVPWLLEHYQIEVSLAPQNGYRAHDVMFSEAARQLFADEVPILLLQRPLIGAIALEHIYLLATDDSLIVLNKSPIDVLEVLAAGSGIPARIQTIGLHYNEPVLQTRNGMWRGDFLLHQWELLTVEGVAWSHPEPLPLALHQSLQTYLTGEGITLATVLADLRSGRIWMPYGVWLVDMLLILMMLFVLRGIFGFSVKSDKADSVMIDTHDQSA